MKFLRPLLTKEWWLDLIAAAVITIGVVIPFLAAWEGWSWELF